MNHARRLIPILLLTLVAGCGANRARSASATDLNTTLRVENRGFITMNVYVLRGTQRVRLGTVNAASTKILPIPNNLLAGSGVLRFLADPVGSRIEPISEEIAVQPGDQVTLQIGP